MSASTAPSTDDPDPPLARVRHPSLSELAYESLSSSILAGTIAPGTQLKETRLSEQLGMSRAPIREAFKRLAEEHLVVFRPRHGVFVCEFHGNDIADIYTVRVAIETTAVRLYIRAGASTAPLRALVSEMLASALSNDVAAVVDAEVRFHQTLCRAGKNEYVSAVFQSLKGPIHMAMAMDDRNYVDIEQIALEHEPVVAAIESGDEEAAVAVITAHITSSVAHVIERLGGDAKRLLV